MPIIEILIKSGCDPFAKNNVCFNYIYITLRKKKKKKKNYFF